MADVTDLQQLVIRRLAELGTGRRPLSQRDAAARSGGRLSHEVIGQIARGVHSGHITDRTVEGLALALDVPRSEILRAMNRGHVAGLKPFEAPDRWQRLTHAQRKLVLAIGDGLLQAYEQGLDDGARGLQVDHIQPARSTSRTRRQATNGVQLSSADHAAVDTRDAAQVAEDQRLDAEALREVQPSPAPSDGPRKRRTSRIR